MIAPPVTFKGLSFKKIANAALGVVAIAVPGAAAPIAAGAAVVAATKKKKAAPVVEQPTAVGPSIFDSFGPQNHDAVIVGSAILGTLLLTKLLGGKK